MISASRAGSSPVDAATALISASRPSGRAMREAGGLRGLGTRAAGFSASVRKPSATAWLYMHRKAPIRCSAAASPPRAFRRCTTFALMSSANWLISKGDGSVMSLGPHASTTRFQ